MLITCPMCDEPAFDAEAGICRHCQRRGLIGEASLEEVLDGLIHNARLQLASLGPKDFQQICGLFSDEPFDLETAKAANRVLRANDILSEHITVTSSLRVMHSLIISPSASGLRRALALARQAAKKGKFRLTILAPYDA